MLTDKLKEQIIRDAAVFNGLSASEQKMLMNFIVEHDIANTDKIFEDLASLKWIEKIAQEMIDIIPFLLRFGALVSDSSNRFDLVEDLPKLWLKKISVENLWKILDKDSNFIQSIKFGNEIDETINRAISFSVNTNISYLWKDCYTVFSKMDIKCNNENGEQKNISLVFTKNDLELFRDSIASALQEYDGVKKDLGMKNIKIYNN